MEDKHNFQYSTKWYQQCFKHCEAFGISKTIIKLFIHFQEQKYEQYIKKLKIPGYETSSIIQPRKNHSLKEINE